MAETENQSGSSGSSEAPKPAKKDPRDKLYKPQYNLVISSSPHDYHQGSVPGIMWSVFAALMPAVAMGIYYYRMQAVIMLVVVTGAAVLTEMLMNYMRGKKFTVQDGSAALTGLLLAMTLPPSLSPVSGALGAVFAIIIGKHIYGGLGYNIFNPALLGRAFLQASFAVPMTTWTIPAPLQGVDGVTSATPLGAFKFEGVMADSWDLFIGNVGGSIGETSALAILIGGVYLLIRKQADWRIPLSYIGSVVILTGGLWLIDSEKYADPLFHVLSGGLMLGAFFMATDMVTSPTTPTGAYIFGAGAGFILVIIRVFGGIPEGVMYSIIFMNGFVPLINRYTRPRYLGEVRK